jgi:hypothetical protein
MPPNSNAFAIGTTPCWSGCLYEISPEIAGIEAINQDYFEEQDDDNP